MTERGRILRIWFASAFCITLYGLLLWAVKLWAYSGWSWRGYLTDLQSLVAHLVFVGSVLSLFLRRRSRTPLLQGLAKVLGVLAQPRTLLFMALANILVGAIILRIPANRFAAQILPYVHQRNWTHARQVLTKMQAESLRPDVVLALSLFIDVHDAAESNKLSDSAVLRDHRHAIARQLAGNSDILRLNTLSFAEVSKALYLVEDDASFIEESTKRLRDVADIERDPHTRAAVYMKLGEADLVMRRYKSARSWFERALDDETDSTVRALLNAQLGNAYAAENEVERAILQYRSAQSSYPEGRRFILHSNLGYLLLLNGKFSEAEQEIKRALRIKPDDWYSYLNLALVYDDRGATADAENAFRTVIEKASNPDAVCEARILLGRTLERAQRPFDIYAEQYLRALSRSTRADQLYRLRRSPDELRDLYRAVAEALLHTNTHATERYVHWFRSRSEQIGRVRKPA